MVKEALTMKIDKRAILQPILDAIEPGWEIIKPFPEDRADIESLSVFQKPDENKEIKVAIPDYYFYSGEQHRIRPFLEQEIRNAKVLY